MADIGHSPYGASVCKRNYMCAGSFWLVAATEKSESDYAAEGNLAHDLAEEKIKGFLAKRRGEERFWTHTLGHNPGVKRTVQGVEFIITQEMLNALNVYVDLVTKIIEDNQLDDSDIIVEAEVHIPHPLTEGLWGQPDFQAVIPFYKLVVIDYKHGAGVDVHILNNFQLRFYALAAYMSLPEEKREDLRYVELIIVQPRTAKGQDTGVKTWTLPIEELLEFFDMLDSMVYRIDIAKTDPYKYLNPGYEWCRFCEAKHDCPALRAKIETDIGCKLTDTSNVEPKRLAVADMVKWLKVAKDARALFTAIEARAKAMAANNIDITDGDTTFVLEDILGDRAWVDVSKAEELFKPVMKDQLYTKKIKSPTQVEAFIKDLKKSVSAEDPRFAAVYTDLTPGDLVKREFTGKKLVQQSKDNADQAPKKGRAAKDFEGIDLTDLAIGV